MLTYDPSGFFNLEGYCTIDWKATVPSKRCLSYEKYTNRRKKKQSRRKKEEKKGENSRFYWSNVCNLRLPLLVMK